MKSRPAPFSSSRSVTPVSSNNSRATPASPSAGSSTPTASANRGRRPTPSKAFSGPISKPLSAPCSEDFLPAPRPPGANAIVTAPASPHGRGAVEECILRLREVTVHHGRTPALERITAAIPCNSLTAVVGPNGAGKTTLLRAILGWHPLTSGEIRIGDHHAQHALPRIAYLPQRAEIDWDFPITVREVVRMGRFPALGSFRRFGAADHERVGSALREMGLEAKADQQIRRLSGGQQQRVFLARALAQGADLFLLDEPFGGLDQRATADLVAVLRTWRGLGRTVLIVIHEIELARRLCTHGLVLDTRLVAFGPAEECLRENCLAPLFNPIDGVAG
ncbi:MAG: ATP-binding cassette domain-containing protein [Puniceicoccaceae bacterium]|nr:MAG: ATP-binding cassette domain-containing protein [Puniceicoccaceae bacterium]